MDKLPSLNKRTSPTKLVKKISNNGNEITTSEVEIKIAADGTVLPKAIEDDEDEDN